MPLPAALPLPESLPRLLFVRSFAPVWRRRLAVAVLGAIGFSGLAGCASLPAPVERPATRALNDTQNTTLGRLVGGVVPSPDVSGFRVVASGEEAYGVLTALADRAERTLDLQYYLIRSDNSSRGILQRVRAAADRGVRVRLLVDDLNTAGQDEGLMRLTQHRNIEVRLYNPFPSGRMSTVSRLLSSLTDIARINQRMHNKMFVADNVLAITGGRNLGDAYFVQSAESNFLDLDVIVAGPAVRRLSATFDAFWNNPLAYPVGAIVPLPAEAVSAPGADVLASAPKPVLVAAASDPMQAPPPSAATDSSVAPPRPATFARELAQGQLPLVWASARVIADRPSKIESGGNPTDRETIADDVESLMRAARQEVVLISPYFVPGERGVALMQGLRARGVKVRVLTNSLATTDAPAVHIGYARYRERLLQLGVEMHELRRHISTPRSRFGSFGSSSASLHAKVLVIDRATALVGSMNMDPRSEKLNSEMGVVIRSPVIAQQLVRMYEEVSATGYVVTLDGLGRLRWQGTATGKVEVFDHEPDAKLWLRLGLKLLGPFAPEEML